jgi:hypothetical protein
MTSGGLGTPRADFFRPPKGGRRVRFSLDFVKRMRPISDDKIRHRIMTSAQLANIYIRLGGKLLWDAKAKQNRR